MINLLETNLEFQHLVIFDYRFPIKLLVEALQALQQHINSFIHFSSIFWRPAYCVTGKYMLQISKSLATVSITANGFVSTHSVQQLADSLMVITKQ